MSGKTRRLTWAALAVAGLITCSLHAAPSSDEGSAEEPLAAELLEARTVYVLDTMMNFALTSSFRTALEEWDRFEFAESPDEADIIMTLTARTNFTQEDVPSGADVDPDDPTGGRAPSTIRVADKLYFEVFVQGNDDLLWTDEIDLEADDEAIETLLQRLRHRMEDQAPEAANPASAQQEQSLAPELLAAKKIFVKQTLIDPRIVSRFRSEIAKSERFEIVVSEDEADIIATLAAEVDYTHTVSDSGGASDEDTPGTSGRAGDSGPRPIGTVRVLEDIHLVVVLPDGTDVWRDSVPAGSLTGSASRKLAKRFRKRLEEAEL